MEKEYICICGKKFTSPQAFNGHKSHCKEHQLNKYNNLDTYIQKENNRKQKIRKFYTTKQKIDTQLKLEQWLSEEHKCENCGKTMTEYYGSGRFCSRKCANSRKYSKQTKQKISDTLKASKKISHKKDEYLKNPDTCIICSNILPYGHKKNYCKKCTWKIPENKLHLSESLKNSELVGALRKGSGIGKKGWYKGIHCDSTYELVYIIYNLDHNISFKRCKRTYKYEYNNEIHTYYPDFELSDGTLIVIKGYNNDQVYAKISSVQDRPLKILYKDDLEYAFNYVKNNYKYINLEDLYE